jgi:hypothetical protein
MTDYESISGIFRSDQYVELKRGLVWKTSSIWKSSEVNKKEGRQAGQ